MWVEEDERRKVLVRVHKHKLRRIPAVGMVHARQGNACACVRALMHVSRKCACVRARALILRDKDKVRKYIWLRSPQRTSWKSLKSTTTNRPVAYALLLLGRLQQSMAQCAYASQTTSDDHYSRDTTGSGTKGAAAVSSAMLTSDSADCCSSDARDSCGW